MGEKIYARSIRKLNLDVGRHDSPVAIKRLLVAREREIVLLP